jgi:sRNA-binding protein
MPLRHASAPATEHAVTEGRADTLGGGISLSHITRSPRTQRRPDNATITVLAELFPATFIAEQWQPHRPLKVGIHQDLVDRGVLLPGECRSVFRGYCSRLMYQRAIAAGGARHDLDGNPVGEVTPEQMAGAVKVIAHLEAKAIAQAATSRAAHQAAAERKRTEGTPSANRHNGAPHTAETQQQLAYPKRLLVGSVLPISKRPPQPGVPEEAGMREQLPNRRGAETFDVECNGLDYTATVGRYDDERVAEIFLTNHKAGSHAGIMASDAAVVCSLALQHGVPLDVIRRALMRDSRGNPSGPLGMALDKIAGGAAR